MEKDIRLNKKSIAILIFSLATGGAERFVSYLLDYLLKQGVEVHLVLMVNLIRFPLPDDVHLHILGKARANEKGLVKLVKIPVIARKYAQLLRRLEIDHSFSLLTRPNLINVLSRKMFGNKARVVLGVRSYTSMTYSYGDLQSKLNKRLISLLYPGSDLIIGNSQGNSKDMVTNFNIDQKQVLSIPNPIDLKKIADIEPITNFFDDDYFNIITTGRLIQLKNHQLLINVVSTMPKVRLYLIGYGELIDDLQKQVRELNLSDRVFFLGLQANPFTYLKAADLFAFSSNHEGFPNVLLEAMACGLPIVSTNCHSGPDEILQYEGEASDSLMITKHGILVPVNHLEAMREGITYFMEQQGYYNDCKNAVIHRVQHFEKQSILKRYADIIFQ